MMSNLFWLTETQMERLRPFFPKSHSKPRVDDQRMLSRLIFIIAMAYVGVTRQRSTGRVRPSTSVGNAGTTKASLRG